MPSSRIYKKNSAIVKNLQEKQCHHQVLQENSAIVKILQEKQCHCQDSTRKTVPSSRIYKKNSAIVKNLQEKQCHRQESTSKKQCRKSYSTFIIQCVASPPSSRIFKKNSAIIKSTRTTVQKIIHQKVSLSLQCKASQTLSKKYKRNFSNSHTTVFFLPYLAAIPLSWYICLYTTRNHLLTLLSTQTPMFPPQPGLPRPHSEINTISLNCCWHQVSYCDKTICIQAPEYVLIFHKKQYFIRRKQSMKDFSSI